MPGGELMVADRVWGWVALVLVSFGLFLSVLALGYRLGQAKEREKQQVAQAAQERAAQQALDAVTAAVNKIEVKSETHIHPLRTEIRTNTVYRDCRHAPDSVRHINALIEGAGTGSTGQGLVPQAKPSGR